jgi:flagellar motor switch protein FliN/FliY
MTAVTSAAQLKQAQDAAQAALALLPAGSALTAGTPTGTADGMQLAGRAVRARFSGGAQGEIVIVVAQDLVDALADTPLGSLDLTQAIRPAIEAAVATLGPVVVDPGSLMDPAPAMQALISSGGVLIPFTDADGAIRAVVGLTAAVSGGRTVPARGAGTSTGAMPARGGLDLLHDVEMEVSAELGRTRMSVRELLSLLPGTVIELDRAAGGPADLLVNGRLIARGEVVVIDENFGIRITEIVPPTTDRA